MKIQYIKREDQENLKKNSENNNDLTEKLNNLKKKNLELDKTLKDTDKKATNLKLIHEYNEIKVILLENIIIKFNYFQGFLHCYFREIGRNSRENSPRNFSRI